MVDQIIDKRTVAIPGPIGTVTPQVQALHDETKAYRDQAETFAGQSHDQLDQATTSLLTDTTTHARGALDDWRYGTGAHAVFIGDSITQGYLASDTAHRWTTLTSKAFGWTEHNYGIGGSGFIASGQADYGRFDNQAAHAAADTSYDRNRVAWVFIEGGVNDSAVTADAIAQAQSTAKATVAALRATYPNARLMAVIAPCGSLDPAAHTLGNTPIVNRLPYFTAMMATMASLGCMTLPGYRYLSTNVNYQSSDRVHPNDAGYALIAAYVANAVQGTPMPPTIADNKPGWDMTIAPGITGSVRQSVGLDSLTISGNVSYTVQDGDSYIGQRAISIPVMTIPVKCYVMSPLFITVPCAVNGDWDNTRGWIQVGGSSPRGLGMHLLKPGTGVFARGDVISSQLYARMPLYGN